MSGGPGDLDARARDAGRYWRTIAALARATEADTAIGATPSDPVFRADKATLSRYRPTAPQAGTPPLIIVHGRVGRASVTDLDAECSLVRDVLAQGVDVYVIDWGSVSRADQFVTIDDHVDGWLYDCVAHVRGATGVPPALLGICEGGVFATCFAALYPHRIAGLALAVTPIDFHAAPHALLTRWVRAFAPDELGRLIDAFGYLPGETLASVFRAMTPARTAAKYSHDLLGMADDPARLNRFLRMERWLSDRPHHPAAAARQLLVELYHENRLAEGRFALGGRTVDPGAIVAPILNVYGLRDHIVPPAQARALEALAHRAPYRDCALDTGHIGVFVSRAARGAMSAALGAWLRGPAARPQASVGASRVW